MHDNNMHRHVFICGLHRSGTSLLHSLLRNHPDISGFANTGAREDEGQHLQSIYPTGRAFGGPGKFCFDAAAQLTETSPLINDTNSKKLFSEWSKFWDLGKPVLLEKSPPNIIRSRFLQAIFPNSRFIFIVRHPIAVSLATQKWSHTSLPELLQHWKKAHEIMENDLPYLTHKLVIRYEDLAKASDAVMEKIYYFLDLPAIATTERIDANVNDAYLKSWEEYVGMNPQTLEAAPSNTYIFDKFGYALDKPYTKQ